MTRTILFNELVRGTEEASDQGTGTTVLAVGDLHEWQRAGGRPPNDGRIAFTNYDAVTTELFEVISPDLVLSPLLARGFDCIDLAQVLHSLGFQGRYRAIANNLPDPTIIRGEIVSLCPGLDFDIIVLPGKQELPN